MFVVRRTLILVITLPLPSPPCTGTTTSTWYTELDETIMLHDLDLNNGAEPTAKEGGALSAMDIVTCEVPAGSVIVFGGTMPHRSLNSESTNIRWSTDYRLHRRRALRPSHRDGSKELDWFYGMKDSLLLRDEGHKDDAPHVPHVPDWTNWANVDRTEVQDGDLGLQTDEFDPIIVGPWMDLWNITTHHLGRPNVHVDRYLAASPESRSIEDYLHAKHW